MDKILIEKLTLIATRVKGKGDIWLLFEIPLKSPSTEFNSITEALEQYFQSTKKKCDFRLSPLKGELYAIETEMIEATKPEEPKKFDIYGEK